MTDTLAQLIREDEAVNRLVREALEKRLTAAYCDLVRSQGEAIAREILDSISKKATGGQYGRRTSRYENVDGDLLAEICIRRAHSPGTPRMAVCREVIKDALEEGREIGYPHCQIDSVTKRLDRKLREREMSHEEWLDRLRKKTVPGSLAWLMLRRDN